jgi:hypothetical protein
MKAFLGYAGAALAVVLAVMLGAWLLAVPPARAAIMVSAAVALGLQLLAFGALVLVRGRGSLFTVGWAAGTMLRFMGLAAVAVWFSRRNAPGLEAALLSLVGVMFVLVILEAIFLRWEMRS